MYAHTTFAYSATIRQALQRTTAHTEGLSPDGKYGWLARDGALLVWQVADGSYAAVKTLACTGAAYMTAQRSLKHVPQRF